MNRNIDWPFGYGINVCMNLSNFFSEKIKFIPVTSSKKGVVVLNMGFNV